MVIIDPNRLYAEGGGLTAAYRALESCAAAVAEAGGRLSAMEGLGELPQLLRRMESRLEEHMEGCRALYRGLDIICQLYAGCEGRVLDEGEQAVIRYRQPPASLIDLSGAADILWELSYIR